MRPRELRSESGEEKTKKAKKTVEEQREYEKMKKRKQRAAKRGESEGPAKRGPKPKINIKEMTDEEKRRITAKSNGLHVLLRN